MYQLFEYQNKEYGLEVYTVAKDVSQALARILTKFPEAKLDDIKSANGDIVAIQYADECNIYKSGVK